MDESLVKAVSQHMGVPETLVSRSAEARAQANNSDVNADRRRGAKRREINSTIKDLKAEINQLRKCGII